MNLQIQPKHWRLIGTASAVLIGCLLLTSPPCLAQPPSQASAEQPQRTPRSERTLDYWGEQLSHERFLRRQSAVRHLVSGGQASIPVLRKMLDRGDLETIENVITVLAKIAEQEEPWCDDGAIVALESIAKNSFGTKAALAKSTLNSFAESRQREAQIQLSESGVHIGVESVALGATSSPRLVARIDQQWNGDLESLAWLRWLGSVQFVIVEGPAVQPKVFEAIIKMPNLAILVLIDCELTLESLKTLQQGSRIDVIELRYIRLSEELLAGLLELRLRSSLFLMGTGVSQERVDRMRLDSPGLEISLRQGGFLGVICRTPQADLCLVSDVVPNSGAKEAGLKSLDVIIRIDDVKITRFDDLQRQINTHIPGDKIAIRYRRKGEVFDTSATLKKLENQ